jgi:hypothetical protein
LVASHPCDDRSDILLVPGRVPKTQGRVFDEIPEYKVANDEGRHGREALGHLPRIPGRLGFDEIRSTRSRMTTADLGTLGLDAASRGQASSPR